VIRVPTLKRRKIQEEASRHLVMSTSHSNFVTSVEQQTQNDQWLTDETSGDLMRSSFPPVGTNSSEKSSIKKSNDSFSSYYSKNKEKERLLEKEKWDFNVKEGFKIKEEAETKRLMINNEAETRRMIIKTMLEKEKSPNEIMYFLELLKDCD
jgi:hypothetical protein